MAVSHTAYDEVPAHDVVSLTWWLWFIQCFVYLALVEFATALAWVQFAQDKQRARLHNTVSLIYFLLFINTCVCRNRQMVIILAKKACTTAAQWGAQQCCTN